MLELFSPIIGFIIATFVSYFIYGTTNSKLLGVIVFFVVWFGIVGLIGVSDYGGDRAPAFFGDAV